MSVIAVLQARMSSSRLPGKVLKHICDKPMLLLQIERVLRSKHIDKLIVATSVESEDDPILNLCNEFHIECFRGDLDNVLSRYYHAVVSHQPDHVVRLTGDCPVIDAEVIDDIIQFHLKGNYDYSSNTISPTYPDGLDVEVMTFSALQVAYTKADLPSEKEHVTPYIHKRSEVFKLGSYQSDTDLSFLRWTVDQREDFELINWIYESLYLAKPNFNRFDILSLLSEYPEKMNLNSQIKRNEGMIKSLLKDQKILYELKR